MFNAVYFVSAMFFACGSFIVGADEPTVTISAATRDENGFLVHNVASPYQAGQTQIRVLLPQLRGSAEPLPVIYVLPVEAGNASRYGNGLLEIKKRDLHNKHTAVFVAPTFSHLPWYCDHPVDATIRQETYFLTVVVPFVEKTYPAERTPTGRLLLGFSKSGWGAYSLLLRHPDRFGRAVAWDAPLMMNHLGQYGTTPIFGSQQFFDDYRVTNLIRSNAESLRRDKRLVLIGYENFRQHHQQLHSLLADLGIPHDYRDGPWRKHDWHSGWVSEAVELLLDGRRQ